MLAYRASAVKDKHDFDWDAEEFTPDSPLPEDLAIQTALKMAEYWIRDAGCSKGFLAFTGSLNFRKVLLPTYKANRAGKSKPETYKAVVSALKQHFPFGEVDGLEGDDLMGLMLTHGRRKNAVAITIDKDLRGVPGWHYNPLKDKKPTLVGPEEALWFWMSQVLTGDTSDGYEGIRGVGAARSAKILGEPSGDVALLWERVIYTYLEAGKTEQDALVIARVSRILRDGDYDKTRKAVRLWTPPTGQQEETEWLELK